MSLHPSRPHAGAATWPPVPTLHEAGPASSLTAVSQKERDQHHRKLSRRVHGIFSSLKNQRSVPWASREQRDLMFLLELDPAVQGYQVLPETLSVVVDGARRDHLPAFRVQTGRGPVVMDVFPSRTQGAERLRSLVGAVTSAYADRGIPYRALLGRDVRVQPRFDNARWAMAESVRAPDPETVLWVTEALSDGARLTIRGVEAALDGMADVPGTVCTMAIEGKVALDLSAPAPGGMAVALLPGTGR